MRELKYNIGLYWNYFEEHTLKQILSQKFLPE